jgi:hypothetical protein
LLDRLNGGGVRSVITAVTSNESEQIVSIIEVVAVAKRVLTAVNKRAKAWSHCG